MTDTTASPPTEQQRTPAAEILATLASLVKFDIRTLFYENNRLLPVAAWPPDASLAVAAITSRELFVGSGADRKLIGVEHRVKFNDRSKSLELSMRQMGLFEPGQQFAAPRSLEEMSDEELVALAAEGDAAEDRRWSLMSDAELDERLAHFRDLHSKYRTLNGSGLIALLIDGRARDPRTGDDLDMNAQRPAPEPADSDEYPAPPD